MEVATVFLITMLPVCLILIQVMIGVVVYTDARNMGANAVFWTIISVILPYFIGVILYLILGRKRRKVICTNCKEIVDGTVEYCGICGQKLENYKEIKKKPLGKVIIITGIVLILVLVVLTICSGVGYNNFEKNVRDEITVMGEDENIILEDVSEDIGDNYYKIIGKEANTSVYWEVKSSSELEIKSNIKKGMGILKINYENGEVENITLKDKYSGEVNKNKNKIKEIEIEFRDSKDFNIEVYLK